ncbi:MAG: hypothetical protein ACRCYQ_11585 [Nocardioides sp.]
MDIMVPRFRLEDGGYDIKEVDAFLNEFFATLRSGSTPVDVSRIRAAGFGITPDRPGYHVRQVDDWLHHAARQLSPDRTAAPSGGQTSMTEIDAGFELPPPMVTFLRNRRPADPGSDPHTDPGYNAIRELPANPPWLTISIVVVLLALVVMLGLQYVD